MPVAPPRVADGRAAAPGRLAGASKVRKRIAQVACVSYPPAVGRRSIISEQVLDLMREDGRHCWTLDDLQDGLTGRGLAPDPSSVFRAVTRLEDAGQVVRVPIDARRGHFEVAGEHHEHLVCESCGAVEPIACSVVISLAAEVRASSGFVVTGHQVVLSGTCARCTGLSGEGPSGDDR